MAEGYFEIRATEPGLLALRAGCRITLCQSQEYQDTRQRQDPTLVLELGSGAGERQEGRQTCEPTITIQGAAGPQLEMGK